MATATKKAPPPTPPNTRRAESTPAPGLVDRLAAAVDAIYRFLASLKLAVISLAALAATLAYATFFESWYGTAAAQEYIYRSAGFAILLAFLAMNILCAALIRFPWKKRQTGFVVTHAGLLILLAGSYYSVRTADEGQVGMLEGDVKGELVRVDYPVMRVWELDPHTKQRLREFDLPFLPGSFEWGPRKPRPLGFGGRALALASLGLAASPPSEEVLSKPGDPFRFVVKEYLPASAPAREHVNDAQGAPMARIRLRFKAPGMAQEQDAFGSEDEEWFVTERKFFRVVRAPRMGAPALISFGAVDRPELVDDFLKPPAGGKSGVARFRYNDRSGRPRSFDWALDGQQGKSVSLPESDLTVTLSETMDFPTQTRGLNRVLGDDPIPLALFAITRAGGQPVTHMALANLPMVPNVIPPQDDPAAQPKPALATIHYMVPPILDPKTNGRFGQIDVLAGPDHSLVYRVFGRGKNEAAEIRSAGLVTQGKPIAAFGGNANLPMTISFDVATYVPSGIEKDIYVPIELPKGKMGEGIGACRVEMTVGRESQEFWLRRSISLDPPAPQIVSFREALYAVSYDVDRKPLGFDLKLDDFDVGFEPGTEQPTKFVSQVRLTDSAAKIDGEPHTISMNHPLYHRGYTFYQSRYQPDIDPHTDRPTGRFQSIFQVALNPGRPVIYFGCVMVVLGAFLQFYMRAGIFTDGGKRERERAAATAERTPAKSLQRSRVQPEDHEPL
jgi:hypothetical protein